MIRFVDTYCDLRGGFMALTSNQAMQPTAGRRTLKFAMTQTSPPAATRALASDG